MKRLLPLLTAIAFLILAWRPLCDGLRLGPTTYEPDVSRGWREVNE